MAQGLPVSRIVDVVVNLPPAAAPTANVDSLLIIGDSDVINVQDRIRSYGTLAEVAADFGTSVPEYLAADLFFSQLPQPSQLYIGRWAQAATHGLLIGGALSAAQQVLSNWTAISDGAFHVAIDGASAESLTGLNFSAVSNLNGVASIISGALSGATCTWDGSEFTIKSSSTGTSSTVGYVTAGAGGHTDISTMLRMTSALASEQVNGIASESALACVAIMDGLRQQWYGLTFASTHIVDADHLAVAAYIEGSANLHAYGVTTSEAAALTSNDSTSIGYQLKQLGYKRSLCQYCSSTPYAIASFFGRAFTVDFNGNNTTITMMFKQEPGIVPENLTSAQASALDTNNYNYYVEFNNQTAIIVNGKVAAGYYFDTVWGFDWMANRIQTDVFNLLYSSPTKIPQTDAGMHVIATTIEASCAAGANNGLLGPGVWSQPGFGQLKQGDYLPKGYYVYAPPIATQNPSDRAARLSVPFQVAALDAGAVHQVSITVNVNP